MAALHVFSNPAVGGCGCRTLRDVPPLPHAHIPHALSNINKPATVTGIEHGFGACQGRDG